MTICGRRHTFDFTHVDDTVRALVALVEALEGGFNNPPPIQFVTGRPTTLGQLAELANAAGGGRSRLDDGPERDYDVAHFVGDPSRARELLGWQADIPVEVGVRRLVGQFLEAAKHVAPRPKVFSAAAPRDAAGATLGRPSA
jgi:nucleoside-diphosphate-sugar epimerase